MQVYKYNFMDEMMVDNFAGGGGASTGIELATGLATYQLGGETTKLLKGDR